MEEYIVPILTAAGAIFATYVSLRSQRGEHESRVVKAYRVLYEDTKKEVDELKRDYEAQQATSMDQERRIIELENDNRTYKEDMLRFKDRVRHLERLVARYQRGTARLIKQIINEGLKPVWNPDDDQEEEI